MNSLLHLLLVEDNPADADFIQELLAEIQPARFQIESVARLSAALTRLERPGIDLVLLDLGLPDSQGLATFHKLREAMPHLPVVVLSGNDDQELALAAVQAGAQDYLVKGQINSSLLTRAARYAVERQRAEVALQESEENYRRLFTSMLDGFAVHEIICDAAGHPVDYRFLSVNPAFERLTGLRAADVVGRTVREVIPDMEPSWIERYGRTALTGVPQTFEEYSQPLKKYFEVSVSQSQPGRFTTVFLDITKRKRAEATIIASETRYRRLFEAAKDGILILDAATGMVVDVNPFLIELLGYSHEVFLGKKVWELGFFKNLIANESHFAELQAKEYIRYDDMALETSAGRRIDVEFISNVYLVDGHKVIQCNIRDITDRVLTEKSHTLLATAVEQAAETIVITDPTGTILYANPAFEKTTGYTCAEALGQNPRLLKSGKHDVEFYRQMWDVLKRGEDWHGHFINKHKNGTCYEEEATISPVRDIAGTIINYVAVKRDVTREVQLEAQFRQSQKMEAFGQLAGGVAHDFNNILAVIQLQAGLMKEETNATPQQLEFAREIEQSAQRAAGLTRQLLLFSRKQPLQLRDLDLNGLISNITKMLHRIVGEDIALQLKLSPQLLWVHADAGMVDQILMNLTVNARDAMPKGGSLIIETSGVEFDEDSATQHPQGRPGLFACVSITDTGGGIPPEVVSRIFDPFFTTKDVGKGTGLGLATVFGITQQHHGWVNVYSEVGRGTTFRVYLPRQTAPLDKSLIWPKDPPVRGGSETLLLVEDEPEVRASVRRVLLRLGYRVLEAPTGAEAQEVWKQHRAEIRLLLTDLIMPGGMNGKELAAQLLQQDPKLKVIYASGYSVEVAGKDFPLEEGVNYIAKPFEAHQLAQTVRKCLDIR